MRIRISALRNAPKLGRGTMMANELVTLMTFPSVVQAGFIRNLLEAEGIHAYLADESTVGMAWHLGNAMGWAKLQVAESDLARATEILEAHQQTLADVGQEEFAAEAMSSPDEESEANADAPRSSPEADPSDDEIEDPLDDLAGRALRAAGFGLIFCPLLLYAAWLIGRLIFSNSELSDTASRRLWIAFGIALFGFFIYGMFFRGMPR